MATTAISNAKPFVARIDGSKDEISFSAASVDLPDTNENLASVIADIRLQLSGLSSAVAELTERLSSLEVTTASSLAALKTKIEQSELTHDNIVDALGYRPAQNNPWVSFGAATATNPGRSGLVPAPRAAQTEGYFLSANGDWERIGLEDYLTREEADELYLNKRGKAASAAMADEATVALNVPYTKRGNIWIKSNNDDDSSLP